MRFSNRLSFEMSPLFLLIHRLAHTSSPHALEGVPGRCRRAQGAKASRAATPNTNLSIRRADHRAAYSKVKAPTKGFRVSATAASEAISGPVPPCEHADVVEELTGRTLTRSRRAPTEAAKVCYAEAKPLEIPNKSAAQSFYAPLTDTSVGSILQQPEQVDEHGNFATCLKCSQS